MASSSRTNYFQMLPLRSYLIFLGGVFCVFAPLGLLLGSSFEQNRSPMTVVAAYLISGCLAVSWAATFTHSRAWIAGIVTFSLIQIAFYGPLRNTPYGSGGGGSGFSYQTTLMVAGIALGYVLFIVFISGQGRRTIRLQTEMDLAQDIHETLVPPLQIDIGSYEAIGASHASTEVGGDLIDVIHHDGGTDLLLADVSGHGVKAGVVMSMVKSAARAHLMSPMDLAELMTRLNAVIEQTTSAEMYTTFAGLRIHGDRLAYALAGHEHILHFRADREDVQRLAQRQMPLGLMSGQRYKQVSATVGTGDVLLVYTDGLNETENEAGDQLGHDSIVAALKRTAGGPLSEMREAVLDLARNHGPQTDDQTVLLVRIKDISAAP